ncbi:hypothetical protein RBS60_11595 [Sinomonas sp. ASV486]|uniref:hypothetical protein n=1 Tax=Sinomonas sp. ASV486 TaxID=3051170 RepID=UPI0027DB1895|nr:hypothetical protein [Sinomonas sp. ASV486]MDQ4490837.1 hypothetical protein [Sinomonas sp. ASV486]
MLHGAGDRDCARAEEGKPDVAMPGAQKLLNVVPRGAAIPKRAADAFVQPLFRARYVVVVAA